MNNSNSRRNNFERVERLHSPFQKLVTLAIAREFQIQIALHRVRRACEIHLHRMIHHQIHRHERLDDFRILAELGDRAAHRRQIHEQRHAGEILQHDARDDERNFRRARLGRLPVRQFLDVRLADFFAVAIAKNGFENKPDGDGQFRDCADAGFFQRGQRVIISLFPVAKIKFLQRAE